MDKSNKEEPFQENNVRFMKLASNKNPKRVKCLECGNSANCFLLSGEQTVELCFKCYLRVKVN